MVNQGGYRVTGIEPVTRALRGLTADLADLPGDDAGKAAAEAVRDRVPRLSGALAATVTAVSGPSRIEVLAGSAAVPYAGVINYGSPARNIVAAKFLDDGAEDGMPAVLRHMESDINHIIRRRGLS